MSNSVFVIRMREIARLSGCSVELSFEGNRMIARFSDGGVIVV